MEKSMQPQVQSEQDKMVPIDTSGDPVEIEVKEENNKEQAQPNQPEVQVEEAPIVEEPKKGKEEELEDYSASVKRRIDKLTRKMREAERREQAAIEYAKNVNDKYKQAVNLGAQKDEHAIKNIEDKLVTQEAFAKRAMEAAMQAGDVNKQVEAQQEIARLAIEKERVNVSKQKRERTKGQEFQGEPMPEILQQNVQQPNQQSQPPVPEPDPKATEWASRNSWFGKNKVMTYAAMGLHEELVEEGFDASTDEYYTEIDKRIAKNFPQQGNQTRPTQKVGSAARTSSTGRRTVKLTPSQVAIAKKLGVPLEEYAKHVKEA